MTTAGSTACDASSDPLDGPLVRALVERLPLPVALLDEELRLVGANPALAELAGTSAAALAGAAWCPRFVPAAQRAGVRRRQIGRAHV